MHYRTVLALLITLLASVPTASAQQRAATLTPARIKAAIDAGIDPAELLMNGQPDGEASSTPAGPPLNAPEELEQQKQQFLQSLEFDRRPSAILKLWAAPKPTPTQPTPAPTPAPTTNPAPAPEPNADPAAAERAAALAKAQQQLNQFRTSLTTFQKTITQGDWPAARSILTSLAEADRPRVYSRLLQSLLQGPSSAPKNRMGQVIGEKNLLRAADIANSPNSAPQPNFPTPTPASWAASPQPPTPKANPPPRSPKPSAPDSLSKPPTADSPNPQPLKSPSPQDASKIASASCPHSKMPSPPPTSKRSISTPKSRSRSTSKTVTANTSNRHGSPSKPSSKHHPPPRPRRHLSPLPRHQPPPNRSPLPSTKNSSKPHSAAPFNSSPSSAASSAKNGSQKASPDNLNADDAFSQVSVPPQPEAWANNPPIPTNDSKHSSCSKPPSRHF